MKALWKRLRLGGRLCLVVIAAYFALAVYGEVQYRAAVWRDVTPAYNVVQETCRYQPPSWEHPMGTDNLGRDVAARLVQGARIAFHVGIITSLIAIPLGVFLGLLGGYFGGKMDSFVVWLCATVASMPGLLFILAISMVVGQGLLGIYLGIGLTTWVGVCRTIRAEVLKHRTRAYVQAARVLGYSHARIMFRHIFPNSLGTIITSSVLVIPGVIFSESSLTYLGIVNLDSSTMTSVGTMLANARGSLQQFPHIMLFPALFISLLMICFNLFGNGLRDAFNPALRGVEE